MKLKTPYADVLPPLSTDEFNALRASIKRDGVRDAIVIDEDGNILDGYHRHKIKPSAPTRVIKGLTGAEKLAFVFQSNFARRNLSPDQRKEKLKAMKAVALELEKEGKKQSENATLLGVSQATISLWLSDYHHIDTNNGGEMRMRGRSKNGVEHEYITKWAKKLGGRENVEHKSSGSIADILTDKYVYEVESIKSWRKGFGQLFTYAPHFGKIPSLILFGEEFGQKHDQKLKVIKDTCSSSGCELILDLFPRIREPGHRDLRISVNPEAKSDIYKRVADGKSQAQVAADYGVSQAAISKIVNAEKKKRDIAKPDKKAATSSERYRLEISAVADLLGKIDADSVDAIICDPPYPEEFLPVYEDLARVAVKLLKPGAPLVVMIGHSHLPEILNLMTPHIQYLWTVAYITPANTARVFSAKALVNWKPVLVFSNGPYKGNWYTDVVSNSAPDKRFHEWGQGESGMAALIERFTTEGQIVLDPFCGGSATGAAAIKLKRFYIGTDIDQTAISKSAKRLGGVT